MMYRNACATLTTTVFLLGCAYNTGGGSSTIKNGQPAVQSRECTHGCYERNPDGSCARYGADSLQSCGDFLDPAQRQSFLNHPLDQTVRPLAVEMCRNLPASRSYRIAVSLRGSGTSDIPDRDTQPILGALERSLQQNCHGRHELVARTALLPVLREIESIGREQDVMFLAQALRERAAADILIVPAWRSQDNTLRLALQAIDVQLSNAQTSPVVAQTSERLVSNTGES